MKKLLFIAWLVLSSLSVLSQDFKWINLNVPLGSSTVPTGNGVLRWNSASSKLEFRQGGAWLSPVPDSRTLTINGTTFDLSANRTWTISAGTASNGLTKVADDFQFGGTLSAPTDLNLGTHRLRIRVDTDNTFQLEGVVSGGGVQFGTDPTGNESLFLSAFNDTGSQGYALSFNPTGFNGTAGAIFTDLMSSKAGIKYAAAGYVTDARSLTDKAYVDAAASAASSTASNGLTKVGNDIRLGGSLTETSTTLQLGAGKELFILDDAGTTGIGMGDNSLQFGSVAGQFTFNAGASTYETSSNIPLTYAADYSAVYTDRSLIDRGYAIGAFIKLTGTSNVSNPTISGSGTFTGGTWTFTPTATVAGLNIGTIAGNPSAPTDGMMWLNTSTNAVSLRVNGATNVLLRAASPADNRVLYYNGTNGGVDHNAKLTFDGTGLVVGDATATITASTTLDVRGVSAGNILRLATDGNTERVLIPNSNPMVFTGHSNASGTNNYDFRNSDGNSVISIRGTNFVVGNAGNRPRIASAGATGVSSLNGESLKIENVLGGSSAAATLIINDNDDAISISGSESVSLYALTTTQTVTSTGGTLTVFKTAPAISASSGSGSFIGVNITPTYNFTGTYSGTVYGVDYNPTPTSVTGLTNIAFRATSGNSVFGGTSPTSGVRFDIKGIGTTTNGVLRLANSSDQQIFRANDEGSFSFGSQGNMRFTIGATGVVSITEAVQASNTNLFTLSTPIHTGGRHTAFTLTAGAYTGQTASTESHDVYFNLGRTVQSATGAITTQRAFRVSNPTYSFVGSSTITDAYTVYIDAAPVAGTNATITNSYALYSGGLTRINESTLGNPLLVTSTTSTNSDPTITLKQNRATTTDNTQTTIHTEAIPTTTTVKCYAEVIARRTGGASGTAEDGAGYHIVGTYKNVAGTATLIGAVTALYTAESQAGWDATFTVSGGNMLVRVTGATNNNVTWHLSKFECSPVTD
jgi:hypothetical protein